MNKYRLLNDGGFTLGENITFPVVVTGQVSSGGTIIRVPCEEMHRIGADKQYDPCQGYYNFILGSEAELV